MSGSVFIPLCVIVGVELGVELIQRFRDTLLTTCSLDARSPLVPLWQVSKSLLLEIWELLQGDCMNLFFFFFLTKCILVSALTWCWESVPAFILRSCFLRVL